MTASPTPSTTPIGTPSIGTLVGEFHDAFGLSRRATPDADVPTDLATLRMALLDEECEELRAAVAANDIIGIADALADITYVVHGTAHTYGIDLDAVLREVHLSNMSKLDADGTPLLREDGKVLKSAAYTRPDVARVLANQLPLF
ncbi:nucleoside triphosphate pyrophosphohydrolase family protein [Tersicoccus sp. Bi-70]|uniref:nucleoside triphosphate pyrophosphohydrolase family protein n=1 Tax=Tersicoccus sp. Bi-70 TaxID=1897634 RepID=UPI00097708AD|nr:nucleoside triphosphate pyrophosphohydrolase family protein [Tersicoccus sp. Bi-70]OMH36949.1 hypothetical protein BGP79_14600 [Tersicoccus sp. Bi-70]